MTAKERALAVPSLREQIASMTDREFGPYITECFEDPSRDYAPPGRSPCEVPHPRLMIRQEMLPSIRRAFENPECARAVEEYRALLETPTDGILSPAVKHDDEPRGVHNFDYRTLAVMEARALEYLLTGEEYYGYRAILGMLNYLRTLDIKWIASDQCREFGFTMYTAALIYDWCYDLLGEDEKRRFTLGVEHILCRGTTEDTVHATYGGVKMEIGFPPTKNGCLTGHGSEMQLLRDYLSYSIAICDEHPGWWNYVGARFENEYLPARRELYKAGMYPQGMSCYAPYRFIADLWSAWIFKTLYGEIPYSEGDMARIAHSMLANETAGGNMFASGDGANARLAHFMAPVMIFSSYLFSDPTARAAAFYLKAGTTEFRYRYIGVSPTTFLLASMGDIRCAEDRHEGLPYLNENRGYLNQYILRNGWGDDAAVVLMKGGGRTTANHDHANAGSFQIWYKGCLTGDTGVYSGYGSVHRAYYHSASVAHNTLLVFNPAYHDKEQIFGEDGRELNCDRFRYSGGQRRHGEPQRLEEWMSDSYRTESSTVMQSDGGEHPSYAYLSSDITPAYASDTVAYAERAMLASYRTDGKTPLVFFVRDRIDSTDPSFRKSFLLQIPGDEAPICSKGSASVCRGNGRLTLSVLCDAELEAVGGGREKNFLISGVQCAPPEGRDYSESWGRLEVSTEGTCESVLLHAITLGERNENPPIATALDCEGPFVGGIASGVAAIFSSERTASEAPLSFVLPTDATVYVAGLASGEWCVNAKSECVTATVDVDKGLLVLSLSAGRVTVRKK